MKNYKNSKLIVQLVEHSAHNGAVVGSNPAKLIMLINSKTHKISKLKKNLQSNNFVLICNITNKNSENLDSLKKTFKYLNFSKINNKILNKSLEDSINLFSTKPLINGSIFLTNLKNPKILLKTMLMKSFYSSFIYTLALKLNSKLYTFIKIKNSFSLNYFQNKKMLTKICALNLKKLNFSLNYSK
jgi:hypothetical protein